MNFNKIELYGFKSFADKTLIPFVSNVTAIVGPNGCGKSNVADAIRWVLGEQSAKSLRGKNMQDVIFKGTDARRSLSYCEVSLFFDNTNRIFPVDLDEVVISRRLDRSGNSEYLLNHNKTRLKDIHGLLHDTGVGTEGYTIVGQDKVKDIISAKPEDRRVIFEDAAGISKLKSQKIETERNLEKTQEKLSRYVDILTEIENRLGPLEKQAATARKYREMAAELKHHEVNYYIHQYENNKTIVDNINLRLKKVSEQLEDAEKQSVAAQTDYDTHMSELNALDGKLSAVNEELTRLKVFEATATGNEKLQYERITALTAEADRLERAASADKQALDAKSSELIELVAVKQQKNEQLEILNNELTEVSGKIDALLAKISADESSLEKSNRRMIEASEELAGIKGNLGALSAEKGIQQTRLANLNENVRVKKAALDKEITDKAIHEANIEKLKKSLKETITRHNELLTERNNNKEALLQLQEDVARANARISAFETKHTLLIDQKNNYDGFGVSVKRLMGDVKNNPNLASRMLGLVAEIFKPQAGMEVAIEVALGQNVQNMVTPDADDANYLIHYLKDRRYGQITFLPLSSYRERFMNDRMAAALKEPGVYGLASKLVNYDSKFENIISGLLGGTIVVNNMDTAVRLAKAFPHAFKIVTLDGDKIEPSGSMRGGSRPTGEGVSLLAKEREIEETLALLNKAKKQYDQLLKMRIETEKNINSAEQEIRDAETKVNDCNININVTCEKLKKSEENIEILTSDVKEIADEIDNISTSIKDTALKLDSVDKLEAEIREIRASSTDLAEKSKVEAGQNKIERDRLTERLMTLKVQIAGLKNEIEQADVDMFRIRRECDALNESILDYGACMQSNKAQLETAKSGIKKAQMSPEERDKIDALTATVNEIVETKKNGQAELAALDRRRQELGDSIRMLENRRFKIQSELERTDNEIKYLQEHIWEEYGLTYANALEFKAEEYDVSTATQNINRLKRAINQLGDINHHAIDDYDQTFARYSDMKKQKEDMENCKADIEKILADLVAEMETRFNDAFSKINENFTETFKELFGGGNAKLILLESQTDDPLDAGVEIQAQPPGKRSQLLSLLSGGEQTLTAIAILFAILKLKAMPFCLLDEVEAALDDANATLFAQYVKRLSDLTQFIVITHRKPTMELADSLYGVTMEEKGVSKIVNVQLSEAVKHADGDDI